VALRGIATEEACSALVRIAIGGVCPDKNCDWAGNDASVSLNRFARASD